MRRVWTLTTEYRTRIAPTPSGFLHEGNLLNFLLVERLAREVGATIALRIDDMDVFRMRPEYVDDIFRCLDWLGIAWELGPHTFSAWYESPTPEERADHYYDMLTAMVDRGLPAFVCACSRRDLGRDARCEAGCLTRRLPYVPGKTAVRIRVPEDQPDLHAAMGDFVLWRREDLPAYQLASLIDDHEMCISHIVRGEDLRISTIAQRYLASFLDESPFMHADIRHHALLTDPDGKKLSKSQGTAALELTSALRERLDTILHGNAF